jgi:hypothetical protein
MWPSPSQIGQAPPFNDRATSFVDNPILATLKLGLYGLYLGIVIDGLFPQIAIALLGGRDPYIQPLLKLLLPAMCLLLWLIEGRLNLRTVGYPGIIFMLYLLLDTIHFGLAYNALPQAALGLYVGYFTFFMVLIFTAIAPQLSEETIAHLLLAAFAVNLIIELAQSSINSPLLPLESTDGNFAVTSSQFYGNIRAFGLFGSISAAGSFGSLIAALAIGRWKQRWSTPTVIAVCACSLLMVYVVRLRLGFIELTLCMASALLLRLAPRARTIFFLPILELGAMLLTLFAFSTAGGHTTSLFDASSLIERLGEWRDALGTLSDLSLTKILFGTGMIQHRLTVGQDSGSWLDSMYLEVTLHIGLIGLALLLLYYAWLYRYVVRRVQQTGSPLSIAVAAVWSSLPALGVINLMYANISSVFCCALEPPSQHPSAAVTKAHEDSAPHLALPPLLSRRLGESRYPSGRSPCRYRPPSQRHNPSS